MKISVVAFMFLLLVASISLSISDAFDFDPSRCCPKYTEKRIPKHRVRSFYYSSGTCRLPSVVFILRNGMSACVNPGEKWVMDIVRSLKEEQRS
ncbi:C-C motif chemokine 14-like [Candoia aspera]|uniref:C-C motif chemokine 14-like n=1 Tax=Candoia aspera TaxID=51853 RepID=UPI002FD80C84